MKDQKKINAYYREYWKKNPDKYEKHKAKVAEQKKKRYQEGTDWSHTHREEYNAYQRRYQRQWRKDNPDKSRERDRRKYLSRKKRKREMKDV